MVHFNQRNFGDVLHYEGTLTFGYSHSITKAAQEHLPAWRGHVEEDIKRGVARGIETMVLGEVGASDLRWLHQHARVTKDDNMERMLRNIIKQIDSIKDRI